MWLFKKEYTNLAEAVSHHKRVRKLRLSFEDMGQVNASIGAFSSLDSLQVISDVNQTLLRDFSESIPRLRSLTTVNVVSRTFRDGCSG